MPEINSQLGRGVTFFNYSALLKYSRIPKVGMIFISRHFSNAILDAAIAYLMISDGSNSSFTATDVDEKANTQENSSQEKYEHECRYSSEADDK